MESAGNVLATTAGKETTAELEKERGLAIVDTVDTARNQAPRVEDRSRNGKWMDVGGETENKGNSNAERKK
jgi:hypothetical protein